jgi:hypothetical protein
LEITKTVLSLMLVVITILTTLTTIAAVYAGGDHDDGNKQKAEDDSSAGIADCDKNDVEEARFLCIAIATNHVEMEPPSEESTTSSVCKDENNPNIGPEEFEFTVTGNNPSPAEFVGNDDPPRNCVDVTIGPGEYRVEEEPLVGVLFPNVGIDVEGDCNQDSEDRQEAFGEIQEGETQECRFINIYE